MTCASESLALDARVLTAASPCLGVEPLLEPHADEGPIGQGSSGGLVAIDLHQRGSSATTAHGSILLCPVVLPARSSYVLSNRQWRTKSRVVDGLITELVPSTSS